MEGRLKETFYRSTDGTPIHRGNIDTLLDNGMIETLMRSGRWWKIRRNGATKRWKRSPQRIRIPIKYGFYGYGSIDETDFE